jgi:hypothetical protein
MMEETNDTEAIEDTGGIEAVEEAHVANGMIVRLGSRDVALHVPDSTAACFDLLELSQRLPRRAAAAALLVCGRLQPRGSGVEIPLARFCKIDPDSLDYRWAKIGGLAYDRMLGMKVSRRDLISAGTDALLLIAEHCKALEGVDAGNSEASPSTSSF